MKNRWRDFALGVSVANLLLLSVWSELIFTSNTAPYYMLAPPAASDYFAAVANTFLLGALFFASVQLIRLWGKPWHMTAARIAFIGALLIALNIIRFQFTTSFGIGIPYARILKTGLMVPVLILGAILGAITFYFRRQLFQVLTILVLFLAPFAMITTGQALFKGFTVKSSQQSSPQRFGFSNDRKEGARVVWIIFDELDESILFENRPPKLFPAALDAFRMKSVRVHQAQAPSTMTLVSIPSLLTATLLVESHPEGSSELAVVPQGSSKSILLSTLPNVFSRAKAAGFHTTAVGWYHPYCRLFRNSLDSCSWQPVFQTVTGQVSSENKNISNAMLDQLATIYPFNRRRLAIRAYLNILENSKKALKSSSGLIFLHFPIPHPPAIYNRDSERLTTTSFSNVQGYLDNVGLVDRAFQQLQLTLEDAGVWDDSAVIVSSDHPWRDSFVFSGKKNLYVPFLLKMPNQNTRTELDVLFQTVKTADLILAILKGEIKNDLEAVEWIKSNSQQIN